MYNTTPERSVYSKKHLGFFIKSNLADVGPDSVGIHSVDTMAGRHEEAVALTSTKANIGADLRK